MGCRETFKKTILDDCVPLRKKLKFHVYSVINTDQVHVFPGSGHYPSRPNTVILATICLYSAGHARDVYESTLDDVKLTGYFTDRCLNALQGSIAEVTVIDVVVVRGEEIST